MIIQDGLRRMVTNQEDVFYYITLMNENYAHPAMTEAADKDVPGGILKGMYLLKEGGQGEAARAAHGLGDDPARGDRGGRAAGEGLGRDRRHLELPELHRAAPRRARRRRAGTCCTRPRSRASPTSRAGSRRRDGPVIASTDYMKTFADQIRPFVPKGQTYPRARHRRLRALRHAREAALLLRGEPLLGDGRGAQGARRRRRAEAGGRGRRDQEVRHRSRRSRIP